MRIEGQQDLSARTEEFDSFWEGPSDVEKGYGTFGKFYRSNYGGHLPTDHEANILVTSCGPGYFVNVLRQMGYSNVVGVDPKRPPVVDHGFIKFLLLRKSKAEVIVHLRTF